MITFWNNSTIKSKLFFGIGTILAIFAVSSAVILVFVNTLAGSSDEALRHVIPLRALAQDTQLKMTDADDNGGYYVMDPNSANWPEDLRTYNADVAFVRATIPKLQESSVTPRDRDLTSALATWFAAYTVGNERGFAFKRAGNREAAIKAFIDSPTATGVKLLADFVAVKTSEADEAAHGVEANVRAAVIASISGALVAILAGLAIAFALSGQLSKGLKIVTAAIKEASDVVSASAREISAGNGDLSQRTEQQAASLEETAASMEQLTATVNQNADSAKQANKLAIGASNIAVKGGQVVGEVVSTMAAINESGRKIVDIISVIDGIAFQTNILALNAAVEAARAGEQGRGFAVVAGEVRTLAQRSAAAAKEIKQLIGDSVDKTNNGTLLVGKAGETMAEIVESVKRVTEIMSAIASASVEQGVGISQVSEAIAQMDEVTQQNAALVEEIAASAVGLEERAGDLVKAVGVLTLMQDRSHAPVTSAVPRPVARRAPMVPARAKRGPVATSPSRQTISVADDEREWSNF